MKTIKTACIAALLSFALATSVFAADPFSVKTALDMPSAHYTCRISVPAGEILEFSARDLERRLGLRAPTLSGIMITTLPKEEQGLLVLDGVEVDAFDFIDRSCLDRLCFVPNESAAAASMTFIPQAADTVTAELIINVLEKPDQPPSIQDGVFYTIRNISISGQITAVDPEGDEIEIQLIKAPVNGTVRFDGISFFYTPYKNVSGKDRFTVCAVDSKNNFSQEAIVEINIEKGKNSFYYTDMTLHPSAYAAIKLHESKMLTGKQIGNNFFFFPDEQMTRGEFLVTLIAASGMQKDLTATVNTGLPNDTDIPSWIKPYVKKAVDEGILLKTDAFWYKEIPIRAEAVVMTDRAAKINDVKDFALTFPDHGALPDWAIRSYKDLAAYKMLDLYDGAARPYDALTNSYCADLLWQLYKHTHR